MLTKKALKDYRDINKRAIEQIENMRLGNGGRYWNLRAGIDAFTTLLDTLEKIDSQPIDTELLKEGIQIQQVLDQRKLTGVIKVQDNLEPRIFVVDLTDDGETVTISGNVTVVCRTLKRMGNPMIDIVFPNVNPAFNPMYGSISAPATGISVTAGVPVSVLQPTKHYTISTGHTDESPKLDDATEETQLEPLPRDPDEPEMNDKDAWGD